MTDMRGSTIDVLFCCVAKEHQKAGGFFLNGDKWLCKATTGRGIGKMFLRHATGARGGRIPAYAGMEYALKKPYHANGDAIRRAGVQT